jgi:uncharacterized protein
MVSLPWGYKGWFEGGWQRRLRTRYGSWAVVTGASSGIGRATALRLAEVGLNLVLIARSRGVLAQMATDLTARYGVEVRGVELDLALET